MSTEPEDTFWTPLVERRIRDAMARGEFDDLPGAGKPIPDVDVEYDPGWWVRKWVERERLRDVGRDLDGVGAEAKRRAVVVQRRRSAGRRGGESGDGGEPSGPERAG